MNNNEISLRLLCDLMGIAEHSFRVLLQANGTQPFTVRQRARRYGLNVSAGYHRAIRIIEYLGCCRAKEHAPEGTGVRGHHDEIESVPDDLGDLCGRVSRNEN